MLQYQLPKLWLARIPDFWDRTLPSDYPHSSSQFSLRFADEEQRAAVIKMESELKTEDSEITSAIPEGNVLTGYLGTYEVSGEGGVETLLSPEKVDTENVVAMHYNSETEAWEKIENITVKDGYVWGTLESFSPIAIFTYTKDIHVETSVDGLTGASQYIICEGNTVRVYKDAEDGKTYVVSDSTGTKLEVTVKSILVGGSADGTAIDSTNITVKDLVNNALINKVISGSVYVGEGYTTVKSITVNGINTVIGALTGSYGAVRTESVNFNLNNVLLAFMGCGEGYKKVGTINPSFASRCWAKEVNMNLINVRDTLTFIGQNCEYFYVHSTKAYVEGGNHAYLIMGGSNDGTNETEMVVKDAKVGIFQTTNRGNVANAKATFTGCTVDNLFVGGDATDSTVTGTTGKLKYEINASDHGSYNIVNGTEAGALLTAETAEKIVDSIKVSRSVDVTIAPELLNILGAKYIVK